MKVQWEPNDIRRGRRVWRDMECVICSEDYSSDDNVPAPRYALVVVETSRIMMYGVERQVVEYLNEWGYRPTQEK